MKKPTNPRRTATTKPRRKPVKKEKFTLEETDIKISLMFLERVPTQNLQEATDLVVLSNRLREYLGTLLENSKK